VQIFDLFSGISGVSRNTLSLRILQTSPKANTYAAQNGGFEKSPKCLFLAVKKSFGAVATISGRKVTAF
jgi:hypothetical protein